ncbi:MAG: HyaD/HybD family hydrogenase maturation endopeptidase [Chloroflexota bacterium]
MLETVVLGMGNVLLRDEGIGVHIVRRLQEMALPENVRAVDAGTLDISPYFAQATRLIIVDAVKGGGEPGSIYRFCSQDVKPEQHVLTSVHQVGLLDELWLREMAGQSTKEVVIIGIEPENMDWGLELSPRLRDRIPRIINLVLEEVGIETASSEERKVAI